jgi:predicted component of type VI protein secretion system
LRFFVGTIPVSAQSWQNTHKNLHQLAIFLAACCSKKVSDIANLKFDERKFLSHQLAYLLSINRYAYFPLTFTIPNG